MFTLQSEAQLLQAFRPRDRKVVELIPAVAPPRFVRHYLAWAHPAGGRVYLVFAVPGGAPTGIAFATNGQGAPVPHLCDWCHCVGPGTQVGLLTARLNSRKTVGVYLCADLGCQARLEDEADRAGRSVLPAMAALVARMGRFASEGLGIDLSGAGR
jgi:hypothetical protein